MISFLLLGLALAHGMHHHMGKGHFKIGKCEDDCLTFVTCLYDTKNNYTEGHDQVKARDLTWDCLWSIDHSWVIEQNIMGATKCSMKVYEDSPREDVEDCYAHDVYEPAYGGFFGKFIFQCLVGVFAIATLVAVICAHCRCYKPPTNLTGCGFGCCKFFCPLAAVLSVDRYQDSTAIAAAYSWCGCVYTLCCWNPKGAVELVQGNNNPNPNYNQMAADQSRNVNWGV